MTNPLMSSSSNQQMAAFLQALDTRLRTLEHRNSSVIPQVTGVPDPADLEPGQTYLTTGGDVHVYDGTGIIPLTGGADTTTPNPPTGLSAASTALDPQGLAQVDVGWTPPTHNTDGSLLTDLYGYLIDYRYTALLANYQPATVVTTNSVTLVGLATNQPITIRVRAEDLSGHLSTVVTFNTTTARDTTPPPSPSMPAVGSVIGGITVSWNGKDASGLNMPADWRRTDIYLNTTSDFASALPFGSFSNSRGGTNVIDVPDFSTRYVWLVAVDQSGNPSTSPSTVNTGSARQIGNADLGANIIQATNLAASAVTAAAIAQSAVTAAAIAASAVTGPAIAASAVTAGTIAASAVTAPTIAASAVTALAIAASAVTAGAIAASAVTAGTIAASAVSTINIVASSITASTIAAGAIQASKLSATQAQIPAGGILVAGGNEFPAGSGSYQGARVTFDSTGLRAYTNTGGTSGVAANDVLAIKIDTTGITLSGSISAPTGSITGASLFGGVISGASLTGGTIVGGAISTSSDTTTARVIIDSLAGVYGYSTGEIAVWAGKGLFSAPTTGGAGGAALIHGTTSPGYAPGTKYTTTLRIQSGNDTGTRAWYSYIDVDPGQIILAAGGDILIYPRLDATVGSEGIVTFQAYGLRFIDTAAAIGDPGGIYWGTSGWTSYRTRGVQVGDGSILHAFQDHNGDYGPFVHMYGYTIDHSSILHKEDAAPIDGVLDRMRRVTPQTYHYRAGYWKEGQVHFRPGSQPQERPSYGLIAEHLEEHVPELVSRNPDGAPGIDGFGVSAFLWQAIRELSDRVDAMSVNRAQGGQ